MSQNDGIMLSRYLSPEPLQQDVVPDARLHAIANGQHPRPSYGEVCKLANGLITRRAKDGRESSN